MKNKKLTPTQFKALQNAWYDKLEASGFEDIEERNSPKELLKRWHGSDFRSRAFKERYETQSSYFYKAEHFLTEYNFDSGMERAIWAAHVQGLSYRQIAAKLETNRDKVHKTVQKLKKVLLGSNNSSND